jgi:hypothetical protein
MKTEADELSMPDAFGQFHLDCEAGRLEPVEPCLHLRIQEES